MMLFQLEFEAGLAKRVAAPTENALNAFLDEYELFPHLASKELVESAHQDPSDPSEPLDIMLNEEGTVTLGNGGINNNYPRWWKTQIERSLNPPQNIYSGTFHDDERWYAVAINGKRFDHHPSLQLCNHSPDGFAWGYHGSGPAQLAFAILLEETSSPREALDRYQNFKDDVVAKLPAKDGDRWTLTSAQIREWLL